ncbi:hypothetical protein Q7P37_010317 [Cladosporium fusiforme]
MIRVEDEAKLGQIGVRQSRDKILDEFDMDVDDFDIVTTVDWGSTTLDIGSTEHCVIDQTARIKFFHAARSHLHGSNEINKVIWNSNLNAQDRMTVEEPLERRKGNLDRERKLHEDAMGEVVNHVNEVQVLSEKPVPRHLVIFMGGGAGSSTLQGLARKSMDERGIHLVETSALKYKHQAVLAGLDSIARNPQLAITEAPGYDIFLMNHKADPRKIIKRPLQIWDKETSYERFLELATESKPLIFELEDSEMCDGLEVSFELFIPRNNRKIRKRKGPYDPAPVALNLRNLKTTGTFVAKFEISCSSATIYVYRAFFGRTFIFGCVYREDGEGVSELDQRRAQDIFDGGIFFGRLKPEYQNKGLLCKEFGSVTLPVSQHNVIAKPNRSVLSKRKLPHHDPITIHTISSDSESGSGEDILASGSGDLGKRSRHITDEGLRGKPGTIPEKRQSEPPGSARPVTRPKRAASESRGPSSPEMNGSVRGLLEMVSEK